MIFSLELNITIFYILYMIFYLFIIGQLYKNRDSFINVCFKGTFLYVTLFQHPTIPKRFYHEKRKCNMYKI